MREETEEYMIGQSVNSMQMAMMNQTGEAESKQKLAESLQQSAQTHRANGNDDQARADQEAADRNFEAARVAEQQKGAYSAQIILRQREANKIDSDIDEVRKKADSDIAALEAKKKTILG